MEPTPELLDEIRAERLARARRMSPEEKLVAGPRLFTLALECMRAGIRLQQPDADEGQIRQIVSQRVARMRHKGERPFGF